jgi:hypothetical protein
MRSRAGFRWAHGAALAALILGALPLLSASCTKALGLEGQRDVEDEICGFVAQCYDKLYPNCDTRVKDRVHALAGQTLENWLQKAATDSCLDDCNGLRLCIDDPSICSGGKLGDKCTIDEDCCGFTTGSIQCDSGRCCSGIGTFCTQDSDCCVNAGFCVNHTCGGVVCAKAKEYCLNDFQCCTGRCADNHCEDAPCPPEGFSCKSSADCCPADECDPDTHRCEHPMCSQPGEKCKSPSDCCDPTNLCYKGTSGGDVMDGVCSAGQCLPDNSDCFGDDEQCCGHYCDKTHFLCGQCVNGAGQKCGAAAPCCAGLMCGADETCQPSP